MCLLFSLIFCRSTIVHSNAVPSKEQLRAPTLKDRQNGEEPCCRNPRDSDGLPGSLSRTLQTQQRIPQGAVSFMSISLFN